MERKKHIEKKPLKEIILSKRFLILIVLFVLFSFFIKLKVLLFLALFVFLNFLLRVIIENLTHQRIDIELLTFFIVITTYLHGIRLGVLMSIGGIIGEIICYKKVKAYYLFLLLQYFLDVFIVFYLQHLNYYHIAIIVILFNNVFSYFIERVIIGRYLIQILLFRACNIIFNLIIFLSLSDYMLKVFV
ncbi:hypothetical protein JXB41_02080 [Candidatus Woesearchaeota archaeon]|nr:hypothetical protein [Candidatus Woesearchaeota archaeon]